MKIKSVANVKPRVGKAQTTTQYVVDQGLTYNEPGITYNEPGIMYGGYSNSAVQFGIKPTFIKAVNLPPRILKTEVRGQADFYRGIPYGLLLALTYSD